jgi:hypothetical protein
MEHMRFLAIFFGVRRWHTAMINTGRPVVPQRRLSTIDHPAILFIA